MRLRFLALSALVALAAPGSAAAALQSANWSGYAVHRAGTRFAYATGRWVQPSASCTPPRKTSSAFWVGIGGFAHRSHAIEQLGTELDCTAAGTPSLIAWYELAPGPMHKIAMTVAPGDRMTAAVFADKGHVTLNLNDTTSGGKFARTIADKNIDQSSAEWIAEAPSDCVGRRCKALPLANFGSVTFSGAKAGTTAGRAGAITSPMWSSTPIALTRSQARPGQVAGGRRFTVRFVTGP